MLEGMSWGRIHAGWDWAQLRRHCNGTTGSQIESPPGRSPEVPAYESDPQDLALHGPRVLGFASTSRVAARYGLDVGVVDEALQDFEARGWVRFTSFSGDSGWSLTDAGASRTKDDWRSSSIEPPPAKP